MSVQGESSFMAFDKDKQPKRWRDGTIILFKERDHAKKHAGPGGYTAYCHLEWDVPGSEEECLTT